MSLCTYTPPPPLSEFVDVMWFCNGYRPAHDKERILPDGRMALVINLREDRLRLYDSGDPNRFQTVGGSLVSGAQSEFHVIDTACQDFIIGLHFKPGGAFPFFGLPVDEVSGVHAQLDALWGTQTAELRERLHEAVTPQHKFNVLKRALLGRLKSSAARHPAVAFALQEFQRVPLSRGVSEVAEQAGLSQRWFIRRFSEEVGLTPKVFCRIRRFHEVLRLVSKSDEVEWADVALACGYYDQAHFAHDFRAFSGLSPSAYLKQRGEYLNHVPLPD